MATTRSPGASPGVSHPSSPPGGAKSAEEGRAMKRWGRLRALGAAIGASLAACTAERAPGAADLALTGRVQLIARARHTTTAFRSQRVGPGNPVRGLKGQAV